MTTLVPTEALVRFKSDGARFAPVVTAFPSMVLAEVTTRCNLSCVHCPSSMLSAQPDFAGDMATSLYEKIVDEIAQHPDTFFRPFNGGEPMLRRDLPQLVAYAKAAGIRQVAVTTNGTLLIERMRRDLIDAGLDHLEVSIDAASAATYEQVRQSTHYDRVVENTRRYIAEVKRVNPARTVTVSFVRQPANRHEADAFFSLWHGTADAVYIREYHQHNGLMPPAPDARPSTGAQRHPCPYVFERLIVHHDGRVRFCEADWEARHPIGDAHTQTLQSIWQGEQYRRLRQQHVDGTFGHPFCRDCTDWETIRWAGL